MDRPAVLAGAGVGSGGVHVLACRTNVTIGRHAANELGKVCFSRSKRAVRS